MQMLQTICQVGLVFLYDPTPIGVMHPIQKNSPQKEMQGFHAYLQKNYETL
jgi:hypothetical protein